LAHQEDVSKEKEGNAMFNTRVVETIYECVEGEWKYRFFERENGVYVKRTSIIDLFWVHSIHVQKFDLVEDKFVPQSLCEGTGRFSSVSEAKRAIQKVLGEV
jgi:hypothetical protein